MTYIGWIKQKYCYTIITISILRGGENQEEK